MAMKQKASAVRHSAQPEPLDTGTTKGRLHRLPQ
jgi:hypothetical protein